jgi:hypothetical protein
MENYIFWRSFVASILVPSNCLCFDSNSSHTLDGKHATRSARTRAHTHTHTHNCHKIMIRLCNPNNTVGIEVLTSASILVHGTLHNLSFIDSYRSIQLDSWTRDNGILHSGLPCFWTLSLISYWKKEPFWGLDLFILEIWGGTYWAGTDRCSQSLDNTCHLKYLTPYMGRHTQQKVTAVCTQWNVYTIIVWLVTAIEVVHAGLAF